MIPTGRLAPSPTGELHLGHAFSFLIAYWHTKSRGGRLLLRHEDVDAERAEVRHVEQVRSDLAWLGLEWESERVQSERLASLQRKAEELLGSGLAYPCRCSRGDLRALGAPQEGVTEVRYPGTCREKNIPRDGAALRFIVREGHEEFVDHVFGPQRYSVFEECGDFLILRKNGLPAYQLAVVLDDDFDGVTEVVRGSDLLPSTARQRLLQRALQLTTPSYFHIPLVTDEMGKRLAKRSASLSLRTLREEGATPASICAYVAQAAGMTTLPSLGTTARDYLPGFDIRQLSTRPLRITPEVRQKLTARVR